jgi:hypothetical protein
VTLTRAEGHTGTNINSISSAKQANQRLPKFWRTYTIQQEIYSIVYIHHEVCYSERQPYLLTMVKIHSFWLNNEIYTRGQDQNNERYVDS